MGNESLRIIQQSGNNYDGYTKMLDIFRDPPAISTDELNS